MSKSPVVVVVAVAVVGGLALGVIRVRRGVKSETRREASGAGLRAMQPRWVRADCWWVELAVGAERLCLRGGLEVSLTASVSVSTSGRELLPSETKLTVARFVELQALGKRLRVLGAHTAALA